VDCGSALDCYINEQNLVSKELFMHLRILVCAWLIFASPSAFAASMNDLNGAWKPLSSDDRVMTIKQVKDKITVGARDLSCTLTSLQSETSDPPSVTASGECFEESFTSYAKVTLTVVQVGRELLLIEAAVPIRLVNENTEPKIDGTYTNKPAFITVYRRVR
jgi:hypothetical protein